MNLLSVLLKSLLTESAVTALGKKTGLSAKQLKKLIPLALPLLLKFLTNNASSAQGLQSLLGALTQHTSTKTMDQQIAEADETDGGKIIGHILGDQSGAAVGELAKESGLSEAQVSSALGGIAPALLSSLSAATSTAGKVDLSDGLDLSELMTLLGGGGKPQTGTGLLGALTGGSGGLLGSLLGGGKTDSSSDGTALLQALLGAGR